MADELFRHSRKQKKKKKSLADVFLEHRPKVLYSRRSFWIVLRVCKYVFGQFNRTKNRGAYINGVIWLADLYNRPNYFKQVRTYILGIALQSDAQYRCTSGRSHERSHLHEKII
jgi:hypothetical protein